MTRSDLGRALARILLGSVLLAAGLPKLLDPTAFARALAGWQMLPGWAIGPAAVLLPWTEAVVGLALWTLPALRRGALLLGGAMPAVFTAALLVNRLRGIRAPCGCFSLAPDAPPAGLAHVALNLALIALALFAAGAARNPEGGGQRSEGAAL